MAARARGARVERGRVHGDEPLWAVLGYTARPRETCEHPRITEGGAPEFADDEVPLADLVGALEKSLAKTAAIDVAEPVSV